MVKKEKIFNICSFLLILIIIFCSVMAAGNNLGGWFVKSEKTCIITTDVDGEVSINRRGSGYSLKDGIGLVSADTVSTEMNSSCCLVSMYDDEIVIGENSKVELTEASSDDIDVSALKGVIFIILKDAQRSFSITCNEADILTQGDTILSAEIFEGTQTINVYKGNAEVSFSGETQSVSAGQQAVLLQDEDGNSSISYGEIDENRLSDFLIEQLTAEEDACFSSDELTFILQAREEETEAAQEAQAEHEAEVLAQGGTVEVISVAASGGNSAETEDEETIGTCTIAIRCDTILDNAEDLVNGKMQYVPEDGVILATTKAEFAEGESVYDVLKRVCEYSGIELEYEWTVEYGGYYIEGINNLYEFDCGSGSGWMYKVNGWYPNYGSSNYLLKDDDVIVWNYTCDLGKDLGAEMH